MKKVIKPPIKPTKKQNVKPVKPIKPTKKQNVKPIKPVKIAKLKIAIGKITAQLIKNNPKLLRGGSGITDLLFNKKLMRGGVLTDGQKKDIENFLKTNATKVHELKDEFVDDVIIDVYDNKELHGNEDAAGNGYDTFYNSFTKGNVYDYETNTLNSFFNRKEGSTDTKIKDSDTLAILKIIETFANMQEIDKTTGIKQYKIKVRDESAVKAFKTGKVQINETGGKELKKYVEDLKKARAQGKADEINVDVELEARRDNVRIVHNGERNISRVLEDPYGEEGGWDLLHSSTRPVVLERDKLGEGGLEKARRRDGELRERGREVGNTALLVPERVLEDQKDLDQRSKIIDELNQTITETDNIYNYYLNYIDIIANKTQFNEQQNEFVFGERQADEDGKNNLTVQQQKQLDKINEHVVLYQIIIKKTIEIYEIYRQIRFFGNRERSPQEKDRNFIRIVNKDITDHIDELRVLNDNFSKLCTDYRTDVNEFLNSLLPEDKKINLNTEDPKMYTGKHIDTTYISHIPIENDQLGDKKIISGGSLVKYKSTGQAVFILYKKKKYKRTIFVKDKRKTRYCKINNEYILLSKLKVI